MESYVSQGYLRVSESNLHDRISNIALRTLLYYISSRYALYNYSNKVTSPSSQET